MATSLLPVLVSYNSLMTFYQNKPYSIRHAQYLFLVFQYKIKVLKINKKSFQMCTLYYNVHVQHLVYHNVQIYIFKGEASTRLTHT